MSAKHARGTEADFKRPPGIVVPMVDPNRCEGKGPCIDVCPVDVFEMGVLPPEARSTLTLKGKLKGFAHRWKQAQVVRPEACRACALCVHACPEDAITLKKSSVQLA
jgi:4Fe-4S ferredoxin